MESQDKKLLNDLNYYVKRLRQLVEEDVLITNDVETVGDITYVGKVKYANMDSNYWQIMKMDESVTGVITLTYASIDNNSSVTSYTDAWTNRATLTYGQAQTIKI